MNKRRLININPLNVMIKRERRDFISLKMMLFMFLATMFITLSENATAQTQYNGEEVFVAVEEMPTFPGGEAALRNALYKNVKYPENARENRIEGKVFVKFIVTKDGSIANAMVGRAVNPDLDKAALDAVKKLPKFIPGKKEGRAVNVWFSMPIVFKIVD